MITSSSLHYTIIREIIDKGYAPDVDTLADIFNASPAAVIKGLYELEAYHGVVLHPHTPKVWVIHPFSTAPTNFYVTSARGEWWGNCAWCSLGIAALVKEDVVITTRLGAETKQIEIHMIDGDIREKQYYVHFPIPMQHAWDNVIYTCSNMLIFENSDQVEAWSKKHNIAMGDIQPIETIWKFAQKWYGNHLSPEWKKWTAREAQTLFRTFGLNNETWQLKVSADRF